MYLPEKIADMVANEEYDLDDIGMSGSSVLIYRDKILKVQEYNSEAENEYRMIRYLEGRLSVPRIYAWERSEDKAYLLMSKCRGEMACAPGYMKDPALQCKMLAEGLKRLWSVDISGCPCDQRLTHKLVQARYRVENGLVDTDNVEPDTFGEGGFRDPAELLQWLCQNMPKEEPVLSHGDYCLPNVFGIREEPTGYIDLGRSGIADKWCDIALCYRSLAHNYDGKYKCGREEDVCADFDGELLFRELGIEPDWEKIRYYILLDELF